MPVYELHTVRVSTLLDLIENSLLERFHRAAPRQSTQPSSLASAALAKSFDRFDMHKRVEGRCMPCRDAVPGRAAHGCFAHGNLVGCHGLLQLPLKIKHKPCCGIRSLRAIVQHTSIVYVKRELHARLSEG